MKKRNKSVSSVMSCKPHAALPSPGKTQTSFTGLLLAGVVFLLISATFQNGFVNFDDFLYLGAPQVRNGLTIGGLMFAGSSVNEIYWHPLTWLAHEVNIGIYCSNPVGHHLTGIVLHSLSAGLLFLVFIRVGARPWFGAIASLFWALHPLRVESFAWIAELKDVLAAFFVAATILAYLRYGERRFCLQFITWNGLGACALMSKPVAVCVVPILMLLDYWPLRQPVRLRLLAEKAPLALLSLVVIALTIYGQQKSGSMHHLAGVPLLTRIENTPIFYVRYIGKVVWPVSLSCFYSYEQHTSATQSVASLLILTAITAVAVWQRRQRPWIIVAWLWFLIALLPNIGLLQAGRQSIADRFTNLAMMGPAMAVSLSLSKWAGTNPRRSQAAFATASIILTTLTVLTWRQIGYWHDSVTLFSHAISVEDNDYMRGNLASTLLRSDRFREAEPHLRAAVQMNSGVAEYHNNLANVLLRTDRVPEAYLEANIALHLAPKDISAAETMGLVCLTERDSQCTIAQFKRAVNLGADPGPLAVRLNDWGASAASHGRLTQAEPLIRSAVALNPTLIQARKNLFFVLTDEGRSAEARSSLVEATSTIGSTAELDDLLATVAEEPKKVR